MNQVKVYIAGKSYQLQTNEEVGYVVDLGKQLDGKIREILQASSSLSVTDACILVGMDLLDQHGKTDNNRDSLRQEAQEYIARANKVNEENVRLVTEIEQLTAENERLQNALSLASLESVLKPTGPKRV